MNQQNKRSVATVVISVIAVGAVLLGVYFLVSGKDKTAIAGRVLYVGRLDSIDLSGMTTDGPGVFKVQVNNSQITVNLDAGESACDRTAITVPNAKIGDKVSISGDRGNGDVVHVCSKGTYIKVDH